MKKLIALCAIASVATAFAADDNVFGCLRVDSSDVETIVSVPWIGAGVNGEAIKVADIVKTANLTPADPTEDGYKGDELWWYNPEEGRYYTWKLNFERVWESLDVSEQKDDTQALVRGNAILLIRQNPNVPFYLYGQVKSSAVGVQELPSGAQSLIAPPYVENTDLNNTEKVVWSDVGTKDNLYVPNPDRASAQPFLILNYRNGAWGYTGPKGRVTEDVAVIPAGQGVWFKSGKSVNDTNTTVEWK